MTKAEINDCLDRARHLKEEIQITELRIIEYEKKSADVSAFLSSLDLDIDLFDDFYPNIIAVLKDTIEKDKAILAGVQQMINQLDNPIQRIVMSRYYIESANVDIIALDLYACSCQYIYKILHQSKKNLADIYKDISQNEDVFRKETK